MPSQYGNILLMIILCKCWKILLYHYDLIIFNLFFDFIKMDKVVEVLGQIWMSDINIKIYLLCLKFHAVGIWTMAKSLNKPRSTLYGLVHEMIHKGWLIENIIKNWFSYSVVWPEQIGVNIENEKKGWKVFLPAYNFINMYLMNMQLQINISRKCVFMKISKL